MMTGTLRLCLGSMGAGKSYRRGVYELVRHFLKDSRTSVFITNIPLNIPAIAAYCEEWQICTAAEVQERVVIIPPEVDELWRSRESKDGPWSFFAEHPEFTTPGRGWRLVLDEGHLYVSKLVSKDKRTQWDLLIRGARHMGGVLELLTQGESLIDDDILELVETRVELYSLAAEPLPMFSYQMHVWWNVEAYFTRRWRPMGKQVMKMKAPVRGGYEVIDESEYAFDKALFSLYDSFSALAGAEGGGRPLEPWERLKGLAFWRWVLAQTPKVLLRNIAICVAIIWFFFGGGIQLFVDKSTSAVKSQVRGASSHSPVDGVSAPQFPTPVSNYVPPPSRQPRKPGSMAAAVPARLIIIGQWVVIDGERGRVGSYFEKVGAPLVRIDRKHREVVFEDGQRYYSDPAAARKKAQVAAPSGPVDVTKLIQQRSTSL